MTSPMAILVFSLMLLLASLGAVRADDCGDTNFCSADVSFCGKADGSSRPVCYPLITNETILCSVCDPEKEACVPGYGGQVYCSSSVITNCDHVNCPDGQACVSARTDNDACFPRSNTTGSVDCGGDETSTYCAAGQTCIPGSDDNGDSYQTCATQAGNAALCSACAANGMTCYRGSQPGYVACLTYVNCATACSDSKLYCAKKNANDDTGVCLPFSKSTVAR